MPANPEITIIVQPGDRRGESVDDVLNHLMRLPKDKRFKVEISEVKKRRSLAQNAYLWGVVYKTICENSQFDGWDKDDVHDYCLGESFGWEELPRNAHIQRRRVVPIKRSSKLSTMEFKNYVDWIQRTMAQKFGIDIPSPNEEHGWNGDSW